jgi:hypothetical protein
MTGVDIICQECREVFRSCVIDTLCYRCRHARDHKKPVEGCGMCVDIVYLIKQYLKGKPNR